MEPAAERLYGYRADEVIGRSLEIIYPDGWPKRITEYRDEIVAGALKSFEVVRRTKSGRERQIWVSAAPVYDASGQLVAVSNIHRDITEWRRHEQSRRMVAEEIVHRAKNMLTVIAALHRRTAAASTSLEDFNVRFGERIKSLATSTDFLTAGNWTTAPSPHSSGLRPRSLTSPEATESRFRVRRSTSGRRPLRSSAWRCTSLEPTR